jgi:hypothetical protein
MVGWIYTIFSIVDVGLQLTAAFFSYQIYTFHKLSKVWLAVPLGFIFMGIRRVLALSYTEGYFQDSILSIQFVDSILIPFIISLLLVFGIWAMYNNFQKFALVESSVKEKVKEYKRSQKRKKRR